MPVNKDRFFILGRVSKVWLQGVLLLILFVNPSFAQMLAGKEPSEQTSPGEKDGPSFSTSHLSFPSWQSSSAFAIGTVIASEYSDKVWVPPLAYGIATLTGLARIHNNDHWASDVFIGSAIGFFTAKAIVALHKKDIDLAVMPVIEDQFRGLALFYQF
jgi:membrane-associated phospholipid phosphatase